MTRHAHDTHTHTAHETLIVCWPYADPLAREMTWVDVPGEMLMEPRVTMNDFLKSVKNRSVSLTSSFFFSLFLLLMMKMMLMMVVVMLMCFAAANRR